MISSLPYSSMNMIDYLGFITFLKIFNFFFCFQATLLQKYSLLYLNARVRNKHFI